MECLFCKIRNGAIPANRVLTDERCFAFEDLHPQAPTHVLIAPNEHIATTNDIGVQHEELVGHLVWVAAKLAAERGHAADGYRLVFNCNADAGQTVFHLHLHLLAGRSLAWPPG